MDLYLYLDKYVGIFICIQIRNNWYLYLKIFYLFHYLDKFKWIYFHLCLGYSFVIWAQHCLLEKNGNTYDFFENIVIRLYTALL